VVLGDGYSDEFGVFELQWAAVDVEGGVGGFLSVFYGEFFVGAGYNYG